MPRLARESLDPDGSSEAPDPRAGPPGQPKPPSGAQALRAAWEHAAAQMQRQSTERHSRLARTLEDDIIPRLVSVHRTGPQGAHDAGPSPSPSTQDVEDFVQLVLARESVPAQAFIEVMVQRGMSGETLYLDLLAPAAQHLSFLWSQDQCEFTQVTLGLARLQRLLHELSPSLGADRELRGNARRVLLLPACGEQATFGLSMVAEFFHHAGWDVDCGCDASAGGGVMRIEREWFDVVGLSAGAETSLEMMRENILGLRHVSRNRMVGVLVGGPIFAGHPERVKFVGADGSGLDGKQAPTHAERLVGRRDPPH